MFGCLLRHCWHDGRRLWARVWFLGGDADCRFPEERFITEQDCCRCGAHRYGASGPFRGEWRPARRWEPAPRYAYEFREGMFFGPGVPCCATGPCIHHDGSLLPTRAPSNVGRDR